MTDAGDDNRPPWNYEGLMVGDLTVCGGALFVCTHLLRDDSHLCERGLACRARWRPVLRPACDRPAPARRRTRGKT